MPETLSKGRDCEQPYSYVTERFAKRNQYIQPYSYIQQPYLDLIDINEVSIRQYK